MGYFQCPQRAEQFVGVLMTRTLHMKECFQVAAGISECQRRFRKAFVALREDLLSRISRAGEVKPA